MPWRKILYERQEQPDNFAGPEFLQGLQTNVTAERYTLREAVVGSLALAEELSVVALYAAAFALAHEGALSWQALLLLCLCCLVAGGLVAVGLAEGSSLSWSGALGLAQTATVFLGFGYGLSPLLATLTAAISTDTIYAMATGMFLLSLVLQDYGVDVSLVSASMCLNARLFGAVCLVSRLGYADAAFAFLALALLLFALWRPLRRRLVSRWSWAGRAAPLALATGTLALLAARYPPAAGLFICLQGFVCLVCPVLVVRLQADKATIHGPWDEAVVPDHDTLPSPHASPTSAAARG